MTKAVRIDDGDLVKCPVSVIMASVDPTDARKATARRFGRSDRSAQDCRPSSVVGDPGLTLNPAKPEWAADQLWHLVRR
jgi:hypothetical protein